jgi:hypothetical protein
MTDHPFAWFNDATVEHRRRRFSRARRAGGSLVRW